MKLEDEIKQKKFRNQAHKLAVNLIYTYGWLNARQIKVLKDFALTGQQYNILRILRGQYPNSASINLLKERMLDKMSDASRLVERLRAKGLVERSVCKSDRRRVDVKITESGLELLKEADKLNEVVDSLFKNLTQSEIELLNDLLDKMRS